MTGAQNPATYDKLWPVRKSQSHVNDYRKHCYKRIPY